MKFSITPFALATPPASHGHHVVDCQQPKLTTNRKDFHLPLVDPYYPIRGNVQYSCGISGFVTLRSDLCVVFEDDAFWFAIDNYSYCAVAVAEDLEAL